jgi:hypothetical protein
VEVVRRVLARVITRDATAALERSVAAVIAGGARVNLKKWRQAQNLSAARAGLLLSGDLAIARARLAAEAPCSDGLTLDEAMKDLSAFATTRAYAALRERIGLRAARGRALRRRDRHGCARPSARGRMKPERASQEIVARRVAIQELLSRALGWQDLGELLSLGTHSNLHAQIAHPAILSTLAIPQRDRLSRLSSKIYRTYFINAAATRRSEAPGATST